MYLACSWTWCIGMFLPVLLIRDYGWLGFVVFAVPNVVGAAALGWVLTRHAAERIAYRHVAAIRAFSACTVAFQVMFLVWLVKIDFVPFPALLLFLGVFAALLMAPSYRVGDGLIATSLLLASLAVLFWQYFSGGLSKLPSDPAHDPAHVWFLLPVCTLGFLLCPYLDPTFLKARRMLDDRRGKLAFTLGFFGPFAIMISGTALYAGWWMNTKEFAPPRMAGILAPILITLHVIPHLAFVIGTQCKEGIHIGRVQQPTLPFVYAILLGLNLALIPSDLQIPGLKSMPIFEVIYRLFLGAYGLVFPAYVWLCMVPTRDGHSGPRRDKIIVFTAATLAACPFFALGFLFHQAQWLPVGVGIVILARLAIRSQPALRPQ